MALGETGDWAAATEAIVTLIRDGEDKLGGELPEGYGSDKLLESFSRELAAEHETDLGMTLPLTLAGYSAAMQGAYRAPILRKWKPVQYLMVPTVVQFIGVAAAGQKKSTLLGEVAGPLKLALDGIGGDLRRDMADAWKAEAVKAAGGEGVAITDNEEDWSRIYGGGYCRSSTTSQGTPEGLRNRMALHGGHRTLMTAEPDALRDISAYARGGSGGSLQHFLNGWDQETLEADRSGAEITVLEPSLPVLMMVQPESFTRYTMGGQDGTDDFVDRGVFSRMLLWEARGVGSVLDFPDVAEWPEDWDPEVGGGKLAELREELLQSMLGAVVRSNGYRVSKGILHAYLDRPPVWKMPKPQIQGRVDLGLAGAEGHKVAARVQQMRKIVLDAIEAESAVRPDHGAVLYPFAQRFTAHVARMAGVLSTAELPGAVQTVDTALMEDVATRLMPWLWAGWWRIMADRLESNAASLVEANALKNFKGLDLTGASRILDSFPKLEKKLGGPEAYGGFTQGEIVKQAKLAFGKRERPAVHGLLEKQFKRLLAEHMIEKAPGFGVPSAIGKVTDRYRITEKGKAFSSGYGA